MSEFQSYESPAAGAPHTAPQPERKQSTLALVSLILGILSWVMLPFLGAIGAVITGHMALKEIRQSGGALEGETLAKVGLGLGYANLVLGLCACCLWFAVFAMGLMGGSLEQMGALVLLAA